MSKEKNEYMFFFSFTRFSQYASALHGFETRQLGKKRFWYHRNVIFADTPQGREKAR